MATTEKRTARGESAAKLFGQGYNCSQAVFLAFTDLTGLDTDTAARISSALGGGMSRMREVCGAVSGGMLVIGTLFGEDSERDHEKKKALYTKGQELCRAFSEECGSYICRDLLGLSEKSDGAEPERRTAEYYKKRPCGELVRLAAEIVSDIVE